MITPLRTTGPVDQDPADDRERRQTGIVAGDMRGSPSLERMDSERRLHAMHEREGGRRGATKWVRTGWLPVGDIAMQQERGQSG